MKAVQALTMLMLLIAVEVIGNTAGFREDILARIGIGLTSLTYSGVVKTNCCWPDQLEGDLYASLQSIDGLARTRPYPKHHLNNIDQSHVTVARLHADFKNNQIAEEIVFDSAIGAQNISFIIDGNKGKMFIIHPDEKLCETIDDVGNVSGNCLPEEAEFLGSAEFGLAGNALSFDAYGLQQDPFDAAFLLVTSDNCVPIMLSTKVKVVEEEVLSRVAYVNLTEGIADTKVFIPPSYCAKQATGTKLRDVKHHQLIHLVTQQFIKKLVW